MKLTKSEVAKELLRRREARDNLLEFYKYIMPQYSNNIGKHHGYMCEVLEEVERGNIKRLILQAPPRHNKSTLCSLVFPCWHLGRNPTAKIVQASYGHNLALTHSRNARDLFVSQEFKNLFPNVIHVPEKESQSKVEVARQSAAEWGTVQGGLYTATSVSGSLTGKGFSLGIIDDPTKDLTEANSQTITERNWGWYTNVFYTRQTPDAAIILDMTRWSQRDLAGLIIQQVKDGVTNEEWEIINLPALAGTNDPIGRKEGDALWPAQFSKDKLIEFRNTMGAKYFESLYQGHPTVSEGTVFKRDSFKYYTEIPDGITNIIMSLDTAFKTKERDDYSACTTWGRTTNGYYLLDIWRGKVEFPELVNQTKLIANKYKPNKVLIEDHASGQSLIQVLKRETRLPIKAVKADTDKLSRSHQITGEFEAGKVYIPQHHKLAYEYIEELCAFPDGQNDDMLDTTVYAISELSGRVSGSNPLHNLPISFGGIK